VNTSLDWLNTYLDRPADAEEAVQVLTDAGFPLDEEKQTDDGQVYYDFEVTSNRPDCLSHVGLARELAAATGRQLSPPDIQLRAGEGDVHDSTSVANDAEDICPLYTARIIRGVKIAPSPAWLAERVAAIGLRPVNNVVDVTNFVLFEMGQPLHAFDLNQLAEKRIVVRRATKDEPFVAIDGSNHKLSDQMLVIADAEKPVAVAGVMGGAHSEVTDQTTDILIESALFDPLSIRTTSRALKLASDSSFRFERGVDPLGIERASRRAAALILEVAGGTLADGVIVAGKEPSTDPIAVTLNPAHCCELLGIEISTDRMVELLAALELNSKLEGDLIHCAAPSHRADLRREVDLIEEVARLHGYDQIHIDPKMELVIRPPQPSVLARQNISDVLVAHGYHQMVTFSFMRPDHAEIFYDAGLREARVDTEKKGAEPTLRPSLIPSLLACRKNNQDAGNESVQLFEEASVFAMNDDGFVENRRVGVLSDADDAAQTLRKLRGTLEEVAEAVGATLTVAAATATRPWSDALAEIMCNGQTMGRYGLVNGATLKRFGLQRSVVVAELDYDILVAQFPTDPVLRDLPRFPPIDRDLSIVVDEAVAWSQVSQIIEEAKPALMESVSFVTTYRGKPIPAGRKSVTCRMCFRDPSRTLQHDEVTEQVTQVVAALASGLGAELRD
jgi:phenylalanyl-tRNA synthetase beta chain